MAKLQDLIVRGKSLISRRKNAKKSAWSLDRIWKIEIFAAFIFLLLFLGFDFWMYQNFILSEPDLSSESARIVIFKKASVERAVKTIDNYADFLKNPEFPFAENPF